MNRRIYYGVTGYPTLVMDGYDKLVGAYTNNEQQYQWYMSYYNVHTNIPSPCTVTFLNAGYGTTTACVKVRLTLEQSLASGHKCHIVLWEKGLTYAGRTYNYVERALATKDVTITNPGQTEDFSNVFTLNAEWVKSNLGVTVIIQNDSTKNIAQGNATMLANAINVAPSSLGRVKAMFH